MISLTVVILFFALVFAALFLIFGTTRNSQVVPKHRHPHRKMSEHKKGT